MFALGKKRKKYKEIVKICASSGIYKGCAESIERLCTGEDFLKVEKCRVERVLNEERIACDNVNGFFNSNVGVRYKFIDEGDSCYDFSEGFVKINIRVKKFRAIMQKTTLESMLILEFTRGCGYRDVYKGDSLKRLMSYYGYKENAFEDGAIYEDYCNIIIEKEPKKNTKKYIRNGIIKTETIVSKEKFNELLHTQYKMEVLAWRYVLEQLEDCNYEMIGDGQRYTFIKEEVFKMGEYYMQKKIQELELVRKQGKLKIGENHTFKCK